MLLVMQRQETVMQVVQLVGMTKSVETHVLQDVKEHVINKQENVQHVLQVNMVKPIKSVLIHAM